MLTIDKSRFEPVVKRCQRIVDMDAFDRSATQTKSRHYMAWISSQPCLMETLTGDRSTSRITVHHVAFPAYGKKCPDFWTVPLEANYHLHGEHSIDQLSPEGFRKLFALPQWEALALVYLSRYFVEKVYRHNTEGWGSTVEPEEHLKYSTPFQILRLYDEIDDD